MSFQKPEKDLGEGPVRCRTRYLLATKEVLRSQLIMIQNIENPQDPHHPDLAQGRLSREGVPGTH
jgi:hypothetical protein